jgi:parafibromin
MYKVVDNVTTMTPDHWDRVVACFVAGPEWQFKKWPMFESGGTAQLFSKVGSCSG